MTHLPRLPFSNCHPERSEGPAVFSHAKHALLILALLITIAAHAHAQGCAQCLDATQSTPPSVQAGYRHAIYLLAGAGATLFVATLALIRKFR
jgi:hypothetical protein